MAHENVYGICENLCKVPVYAKDQTYSKTEANNIFSPQTIYGNQHLSMGRNSEYLSARNTAVIGSNSDADKDYSMAIGTNVRANGTNSLAIGEGVESKANGQLVSGEYNVVDTTSAFIVGNGTSASNKSNAFTVDRSGNGVFKGTCTATSHPTSSSRKVKENIEEMPEEEAKKILEIEAVEFDYINGAKEQRGVIAEDVYEIIPSVVAVPEGYDFEADDNEGKVLGVDYSKFVPYLIKMVQMQQAEIEELKRRLG